MSTRCDHFDDLRPVAAPARVCEDCVKTGDTWVHLRQCLICGHTACCDSSKNRHATKHFHLTAHPVMRSAQPGELWGWCYVNEVMVALE